MPDARVTMRYRKAYAALLRFYPKRFRRRFAEQMELTFHDLCRERQTNGRPLLVFALGLFAEGEGISSMVGIFSLNALFVLLFIGSALLYRRAGNANSLTSEGASLVPQR